MGLAGMVIVALGGAIALASYDLTEFFTGLTIAVIIGGGLIAYDFKSPTETTVTYIETTDGSLYGINIFNPSKKLLKIRKTETEALRVGAVLYDNIKYELMIEEGE